MLWAHAEIEHGGREGVVEQSCSLRGSWEAQEASLAVTLTIRDHGVYNMYRKEICPITGGVSIFHWLRALFCCFHCK